MICPACAAIDTSHLLHSSADAIPVVQTNKSTVVVYTWYQICCMSAIRSRPYRASHETKINHCRRTGKTSNKQYIPGRLISIFRRKPKIIVGVNTRIRPETKITAAWSKKRQGKNGKPPSPLTPARKNHVTNQNPVCCSRNFQDIRRS